MEQNNHNRSQIWRIRTIAVGAAAGVFAACVVLAAFAAVSCAVGRVSAVEGIVPWCVWSVCGLASGVTASLLGRKNHLPNSLIAAALGTLVLALLGLAAPKGDGGSLLLSLLCLGAGALGAVLGVKMRF